MANYKVKCNNCNNEFYSCSEIITEEEAKTDTRRMFHSDLKCPHCGKFNKAITVTGLPRSEK